MVVFTFLNKLIHFFIKPVEYRFQNPHPCWQPALNMCSQERNTGHQTCFPRVPSSSLFRQNSHSFITLTTTIKVTRGTPFYCRVSLSLLPVTTTKALISFPMMFSYVNFLQPFNNRHSIFKLTYRPFHSTQEVVVLGFNLIWSPHNIHMHTLTMDLCLHLYLRLSQSGVICKQERRTFTVCVDRPTSESCIVCHQ